MFYNYFHADSKRDVMRAYQDTLVKNISENPTKYLHLCRQNKDNEIVPLQVRKNKDNEIVESRWELDQNTSWVIVDIKPQNTQSVCTTREKETDRDTFFFQKKMISLQKKKMKNK